MKINIKQNLELIIDFVDGIQLYKKSKFIDKNGYFEVYHYRKEYNDNVYSYEFIIIHAFFMLLSVLNIRYDNIFKTFINYNKKAEFDKVKIILSFYDEEDPSRTIYSPDNFFNLKLNLKGKNDIMDQLDKNYTRFSKSFRKRNLGLNIDMDVKTHRYILTEIKFMIEK